MYIVMEGTLGVFVVDPENANNLLLVSEMAMVRQCCMVCRYTYFLPPRLLPWFCLMEFEIADDFHSGRMFTG